MIVAYIIVAALVVAAIYFGVRYFVRAAGKFGGSRVIVCPETGKQAMVEVDTAGRCGPLCLARPIFV
jgi:hypothetical protein